MNNIQYPLDGSSGWGESVRSNFHEFENNIDDLNLNKTNILSTIGDETMGTTATTLKGAIAEHEGDISGITTQLNEKANKNNAQFTGTMKLEDANILTDKKTNVGLTPYTNITIVSQNCYIQNKKLYINIQVEKTDASTFDANVTYYVLNFPSSILKESGALSAVGINSSNLWTISINALVSSAFNGVMVIPNSSNAKRIMISGVIECL